MKKLILLCLVILFVAGCKFPFKNPFGGDGDDSSGSKPSASRVLEPTAKFSLAVGGVALGRDELVIYDPSGQPHDFSGKQLVCVADKDIVILRPRPDYNTEAEGSGVQIIAMDVGITNISCAEDGKALDQIYEVTISPQSLIQILVAEAGTQLGDEAKMDEAKGSGVVSLESDSPTGNAIASVISNRVTYINEHNTPEIFGVSPKSFDQNPPESYYDAVIFADGQFSPIESTDPTHEVFIKAEDRNFLDSEWLVAYDQAVLTAARVFNGDTKDSTGGSFAFISPDETEWTNIIPAINSAYTSIPDNSGFTDFDFPLLAPIQILVIPHIWKYDDGRPAFTFARSRSEFDLPVVNVP